MATFAHSAAVLVAMRARLEALTPGTQASADDRFRFTIGVRAQVHGSRAGLLACYGGKPKFGSGRTNKDWTAPIELSVWYVDMPTGPDQVTMYEQALTDAEAILADLFTWVSQTDGLNQMDADDASIEDDGQGYLRVTRTVRVEYKRT